MTIRIAKTTEFHKIWPIFKSVVATGDTYVFPPNINESDAKSNWMAPQNTVYLAEDNGLVLGTYILKANQIGLGAHIANASFMVSPDHHGKGIGRAMAQHCLIQAKESGYNAMQFNIVISTNTSAINLWQSLGFQIIGTTPKAFNHQTLGLIDSHIMFKAL